jgi:intein/homing endonuclease
MSKTETNYKMTPSTRANSVMLRTYSRVKNDDKLENWNDIVNRVINHQTWLWERELKRSLLENEIDEMEELKKLIINKQVMPSGRTLWLCDTSISKTRESSMFNCSFLYIETIYDIVDLVWLLLQGCGVGFKPVTGSLTGFRNPINNIEIIRSKKTLNDQDGDENNYEHFDPITKIWTVRIGDSAVAWAKSIGKLLASKYPATKLVLDFSNIRAAGHRLKHYGWLSFGDGPISKAYVAICKILSNRADSMLSKIDILDIVNWIGTILSTRRSAQIALVEYGEDEWYEFAIAKRNFWEKNNYHRQQSNNSLILKSKPSYEELLNIFKIIEENGYSEPGFINMETALKRAPFTKGINPCISGDSLILTDKGLIRADNLIGKKFNILLNGKTYSSTDNGFFKTGNKPVFKLKLKNGYEIKATDNHKFLTIDGWKELKNISVNDKVCISNNNINWNNDNGIHDEGYIIGQIIGNGTFSYYKNKFPKAIINLWIKNKYDLNTYIPAIIINNYCKLHNKNKFINVLKTENYTQYKLISKQISILLDKYNVKPLEKKVVENGSYDFTIGMLRGLFDSDGAVVGNHIKGCSVRFSQVKMDRLLSIQKLLLTFNIISCIYKNRKQEQYKIIKNKKCKCKAYHELVISNQSLILFSEKIGFKDNDKNIKLQTIINSYKRTPNKDKSYSKVESIENLNICEDVYDCTINEVHAFSANGIITHNCGEVMLPNKGFCNLTEINLVSFKGNKSGLERALYLVGRMNYRQTLVNLKDEILQEAWHLNNQFYRLCGVGLTGITACDYTEYEYKRMRNCAINGTYSMANELKLPISKNITLIKPSGTLSKLMGSVEYGEIPEGIHKPMSKYIFNWIGYNKKDALVDKLREAGYDIMNKPADNESVLIKFPIKYDNIKFDTVNNLEINRETAIEQLNRYKLLMTAWADQNCSITVSYMPEEIPQISRWILDNWDIYVGTAFLLRNDPTKTAKDLGYPYLPQECISKKDYDEYVAKLKDVDYSNITEQDIDTMPQYQECAGGACPIR